MGFEGMRRGGGGGGGRRVTRLCWRRLGRGMNGYRGKVSGIDEVRRVGGQKRREKITDLYSRKLSLLLPMRDLNL